MWHILVLAQQLAASRESSPARRCCELFVCLSILLGGCHLHIALGRTENDAVPNHLRPPLQLIFRFNNNNRPERDGPKHFPAQQSIRAYSETLPAGWFTSSAALHTRLNFALFQKCHFHLAVFASPLLPVVSYTPAKHPQLFRSQFYFISITTWKPDQTVS